MKLIDCKCFYQEACLTKSSISAFLLYTANVYKRYPSYFMNKWRTYTGEERRGETRRGEGDYYLQIQHSEIHNNHFSQYRAIHSQLRANIAIDHARKKDIRRISR